MQALAKLTATLVALTLTSAMPASAGGKSAAKPNAQKQALLKTISKEAGYLQFALQKLTSAAQKAQQDFAAAPAAASLKVPSTTLLKSARYAQDAMNSAASKARYAVTNPADPRYADYKAELARDSAAVKSALVAATQYQKALASAAGPTQNAKRSSKTSINAFSSNVLALNKEMVAFDSARLQL